MTEQQYKNKVYEMATGNHIWLNAFACINPSKEFYEQVGKMIIDKLKDKENLLPSFYGDGNDSLKALGELTPMLYLSINKS